MKFSEMHLKKEVVDALTEIGLTDPTGIQEKTIQAILSGKDVLGQAET